MLLGVSKTRSKALVGRRVSTCPGLRQYWIEKSGQMQFKIGPAQLADSDDPVWAEAGFFSSYSHPQENVTRARAFFSTGMTTEYSRAHTAFLLHPILCAFPVMREPKLRSAGSRAGIGIRKHLFEDDRSREYALPNMTRSRIPTVQ